MEKSKHVQTFPLQMQVFHLQDNFEDASVGWCRVLDKPLYQQQLQSFPKRRFQLPLKECPKQQSFRVFPQRKKQQQVSHRAGRQQLVSTGGWCCESQGGTRGDSKVKEPSCFCSPSDAWPST